MTTTTKQIFAAQVLGTLAFQNGEIATAAHNKNFMQYLRSLGPRQIGEVPEGEASTLDLLDAFNAAWHTANLTA